MLKSPGQLRNLYVPSSAISPLLAVDAATALFLPATVSAAMALEERQLRAVRMSDVLEPEEFHAIWQLVITTVWTAIESAASITGTRTPQLMPIFGYSIALALAQALALTRLLDGLHTKHGLKAVYVDARCGSSEYIFGSGLDDVFYCEVAAIWASSRGIECHQATSVASPCATTTAGPVMTAKPQDGSLRGRLRRVKRRMEREANRFRASLLAQALMAVSAVIRGRSLVLLTNCAHRFPPMRPQDAGRISVRRFAGHLSLRRRPRLTAEKMIARLRMSPEWRIIAGIAGPFEDHLLGKISRRLDRLWDDGLRMYRHAAGLARAIRACGGTPAIMSDSVFCDFIPGPMGFAAEAFRQHGGKIVEIQHGGNYTCMKRGFTATILTTGLGHLFLEWNDLACREHETYGLRTPHLKFATVGCWSTQTPIPAGGAAVPAADGRRLRVLYAPTLLSTVTIAGINAVWDDYILALDRILGLLDHSGLEVDVSIIPDEEMGCFLSRRRYTNLRFHSFAFRRLAPQADVLIADMLAGSPAYEATMTSKPAIVLTGFRQFSADTRFVRDFCRRCITYDDLDDYVAGLSDFVAAPREYLRKHERVIDPAVMLDYFRPIDAARFWEAVTGLADRKAVGARG